MNYFSELKKFIKSKDPELAFELMDDPFVPNRIKQYVMRNISDKQKLIYLVKYDYIPQDLLFSMMRSNNKLLKFVAYLKAKQRKGTLTYTRLLREEVYTYARSDNLIDLHIAFNYYVTTSDEGIGCELASNENLPADMMNYLYLHGSDSVKQLLAKNPNIPDDLIEKLASTKDPFIICSLLENKNLTPDKFCKIISYVISVRDNKVREMAKEFVKKHNLPSIELLLETAKI
jgi:hypothetical protein